MEFEPATVAEHLMWLLGEHGVEHLFLNPGTDSAPLQEAAAVLADADVPIPRVITSTFESVALAAAHGYWQVTGRPQCVFVHVDVGTQNLGAMMHNAMRDHAGVLVIAGRTPYAEEEDSPGGRNHVIHWQQDVPDQMGIVRGYAKWSFEAVRADTLPRVIGRALQMAAGGMPGPSYLMASRDVLMDPPSGFPGRTDRFALPRPPAADPETVRLIADRLAVAERPLLITAKASRARPAAGFTAVTRFAEVAGVRVIDVPESGCVNIATSHPMAVRSTAAARKLVAEADLVIVADCDVPWIPRFVRPRADATIVQIDPDPLKTAVPLWTFPVDVAVTADAATALGQIADAFDGRAGRATWPDLAAAPAVAAEPVATAEPVAAAEPVEVITAADVMTALNAVLRDDDIVVQETVTNSATMGDILDRTRPGTLLGTGSPGLGWGLGGSVGVRLASPGKRVVAVVGDGSFLFGVPTSALALAAEAEAPIMVVVLNNDGYKASRMPVFDLFPGGVSAARREAVGTRFSEPPDLAAVARACHADGERVTDAAELVPALRRGLKSVEAGRSSVVDVHIARD